MTIYSVYGNNKTGRQIIAFVFLTILAVLHVQYKSMQTIKKNSAYLDLPEMDLNVQSYIDYNNII